MATFIDGEASTRYPIIILFTIGAAPSNIRCRYIIQPGLERNTTEKLTKDGLGRPSWIPLGEARGLPCTEILVTRALRLIFDNAPGGSGLRLWPEGVNATADGFEIELGNIK